MAVRRLPSPALRDTSREFGPSIVLAFFRPKMGGFQPFLRARRANYMTEGLGDVAGAHWQHTKRRLPWGPLLKRSETARNDPKTIQNDPKTAEQSEIQIGTRH